MSHITKLCIKNYRGIKELTCEFGQEKFIVLIGRGDSGKSTILSAVSVLKRVSQSLLRKRQMWRFILSCHAVSI